MASFSTDSDFTRIATDDRNIQEISELIVTEFVENDLSEIFNVRTDVKGGQQLAVITPTEKKTLAYQDTATPTYGTPNVASRKFRWNLKGASFRDRIFYNSFKESWTKWLIGDQGNAISFDASQVFNFITEYVANAFYSDILRISLHGRGAGLSGGNALSTAAASVNKNAQGTNILRSADDIKYYNIIEYGLIETCKFWKRSTGAPYNELAGNFVDINLNANNRASGTGTGEQYNLPTNYSRELFDQLVYDSTINISPNVIIANGALVQNYERSLTKNNNLQSNEDRFISGATGINALGYNLVKLQQYDRQRRADFTRNYNSVTGTNKAHTDTAHFALWANKDNLELAINGQNALNNLRITFPDGADEYVYIKGDYEIDFKFTAPVAGGFRCAL